MDILRKCFAKKPWFLGVKPGNPFTSALLAWAEAQVTLWDEPFAPPESYGVFKPGLDQPPGLGDGDLDMSTAGVPGMVGRASPSEPPESPLVVPSLLGRPRLRFGGCVLAADERRRRWPALLEKDD